MFIQYYKYHKRYRSEKIMEDSRLQIVYPTDEHAMITAEHDFYVIGTFEGIEIEENAVLKVELTALDDHRKLRTVATNIKNNRQGMNIVYAGIESEDNEELLRCSGMPDLVYDQEKPESFWYTWNKAYYTDHVFSALVYGGSYDVDEICQVDQYGERLEPLKAGEYELSVTLYNGGETIRSAKTILLATGQKEIILSRFSPEEHVALVEQFAREEGFEDYTDPYVGIWDTQYFSIDWPVKSHIEIPKRWHWGDAQEYQTGKVHFFNYNISEPCISYEVELGTMLSGNPDCVNDPERLATYYYYNGGPNPKEHGSVWRQISVMDEGKYLFLLKKELSNLNGRWELMVETVMKVLPATPAYIGGCRYQHQNRIAELDYHFFAGSQKKECYVVKGQKVGCLRTKEDGSEELLILQAKHSFPIADEWAGQTLQLLIKAKDCMGKIWDEMQLEVMIPIEPSVCKAKDVKL